MTDRLSDDAQDFITRALGDERSPSQAELARIRRGVLAGTAGAGTVLTGGSAVALGGKTLGATLLASAVKGIAIGAVVAVGATAVSRHGEPSAPERTARVVTPGPGAHGAETRAPHVAVAATTESEPELTVPSEPAEARRSEPEATPPSSDDVPAAAPLSQRGATAELAARSGALGFELDVLRRAQAELRAERGAEALRILDENAGALAGGRLGQERLALEVLAACQAGRLERALLAARRFHRENAATPAAARIRASCVGHELP